MLGHTDKLLQCYIVKILLPETDNVVRESNKSEIMPGLC